MLLELLEKIDDPRRAEGKRYKLPYVMIISIMAVLSGANSYRRIRTYIKVHRERLNELFGINWKSAPVHSTIQAIFSSLDVNDVELAFREHSFALLEDDRKESHSSIAVDGKVLRGSFDHFHDQSALQMLSMFCQEEKIILCHIDIETKTNEIPVAQELIRDLGLEGILYTFDALHCQKKHLKPPKKQVVK